LKKVIPSVVKREELFITSKLWNSSHQPQEVEKELDLSLKETGLEYFDLYLIHWPCAFAPGRGLFPDDPKHPGFVELDTETSLVDTWKTMIKLPKSKVKAVGVSNFSPKQIQALIDATGVVPACNQVEGHPLLPQDELKEYCDKLGIHITIYSTFGNNSIGRPMLIEHPVVKDVATKLNATPAQVLIAWGVKKGFCVIPKSVTESRIKSNFQQIELSDEDWKAVADIGKGDYTRFNIPYRYKPKWDISIFDEPEEKEATVQVKIL